MNIRRLLTTVAAVTAVTSLLAACGDTEDSSDKSSDQTTAEGSGDAAATALDFTAEDIKFAETKAEATAGDLEVTLTNDGVIEHTWEIEGHEDDLKLHVMKKGDTDEGTITLEPGTYTFYCAIAGHRDAGMEGTLTVK